MSQPPGPRFRRYLGISLSASETDDRFYLRKECGIMKSLKTYRKKSEGILMHITNFRKQIMISKGIFILFLFLSKIIIIITILLIIVIIKCL